MGLFGKSAITRGRECTSGDRLSSLDFASLYYMVQMAYSRLTVPQLKLRLAEKGASTRGRKHDLIERLEGYDRNFNFQAQEICIPSATIPAWPKVGFKQVTVSHQQDIPDLRRSVVEAYFLYRQVLNGENKDVKALEKGQLLVEGRNIDAVSMLKDDAGDVFLSCIVRAAMKKKLSYSLKIKIDKSGEVVASHCECPCGVGPSGTCKHIASVLLMLIEFKKTGKLSLTRSCTDILQTFHRPKKTHNGSPVKAVHLGHQKKKGCTLEDPRPEQYRSLVGYNDLVQSHVLNYCALYSEDLSIRYLYQRADLRAAVADHDYCELPFTEYWVDRRNQVTPNDVWRIEAETRNQSKSKLWFVEREWRITASRFGDILKATTRRNMDKLCQSLLFSQHVHTPSVLHGTMYEPVALERFESKFKLSVRKCGLFVSEDAPYLAATPDGLVGDNATVEVKCPFKGRESCVDSSALFPFLEKTDNGLKLKKTHKYYDQVQGQLLVTKRVKCYFVVFTFKDLFVEIIEAEEVYNNESRTPRLELFYKRFYRPFVAKAVESGSQ